MSHDPTDLSRCATSELLMGGDWASAENHDEALAAIARQLALRMRPGKRFELEQVARLCGTDMSAATGLWIIATEPVRTRDPIEELHP